MPFPRVAFLTCASLIALLTCASTDDADRLWTGHIRPLFADHCFKCHGNIEAKGGLTLMSPAEIFKGGADGPVVKPGNPDASPLYKSLLADADPHMPKKGKQLPDDDIALIKRWIESLGNAPVAEPIAAASAPKSSPLFIRTNWQAPPGATTTQVIDQLIEKRWHELNLTPSATCDDRTFVRRVYLDLAGRIPKPDELARFLEDKNSSNRAALVNTLLDSPDYAQRMRDVFDVVFNERGAFQSNRDRRRGGGNNGLQDKWLDYLEWSFRENRPWNTMTREILTARPAPTEAKAKGAAQFLYARKDNVQLMAESTGTTLLGLTIKCAQCHDHPLAPEIKQAHYWGMVAVFNRSKGVDTNAGPGVAESAIGGFVKFTNLKGTSTDARVMFLDGKTLDETWPKEGAKETESVEQYTNSTLMGDGKNLKGIPVPKYSRREQFANWLCEPTNPLLARNFVNRLWALLIGRGFVHPVDRLDSSRAASHPELLDYLADDFAKNNYDIKRLIRAITATRAYQLDSRAAPSRAAHASKRPLPDSFADALDKPLTAEVLLRSTLIAAGIEPDAAPDLSALRKDFIAAFPDVFPLENVSTLKQALMLSNNPRIDDLLKSPNAKTITEIAALDDAAKVKALFARALSREPDNDELAHSMSYLKEHTADGARQVLWALLTSAEFRINH